MGLTGLSRRAQIVLAGIEVTDRAQARARANVVRRHVITVAWCGRVTDGEIAAWMADPQPGDEDASSLELGAAIRHPRLFGALWRFGLRTNGELDAMLASPLLRPVLMRGLSGADYSQLVAERDNTSP